MIVLKDLEEFAGWWRVGLLYLLSGITGNIASAVFTPYAVNVGPGGACFGQIGALFVELFQNWQLLFTPVRGLLKLIIITTILFALGITPWVDNYSHVFGFITGVLVSFAIMPYVCFSKFIRYNTSCSLRVSMGVLYKLDNCSVGLYHILPI